MKFKKTKWGEMIINEQMVLIRSLSHLDVKLDFFGDMDEEGDVWLAELNYYIKDYPEGDIFKGQRKFVGQVDCENETALIFDLQKIIDVLYVMKKGIPCDIHFPNRIPHKNPTKKQMQKLLKDSVPLR